MLQANNDITLAANSNISTSASGAGGALTLQAGRRISLNSSIITDNGTFTAIAGDPGANHVFTDPGTPNLTFSRGANLEVGTGTATLTANGGDVNIMGSNVFSNGAVTATGKNLNVMSTTAPRCCRVQA